MAVGGVKGGFVVGKCGKRDFTDCIPVGTLLPPGDDSSGPAPFGYDPSDDQKGRKQNDKKSMYDPLIPVASDLEMGFLQPYADGLADLGDGGIGFLFREGQKLR